VPAKPAASLPAAMPLECGGTGAPGAPR